MFDNVINPNGKPGLLTVSLSADPKLLWIVTNNQSSWFIINPGATLPITNWMTVKYKRYSYIYNTSELGKSESELLQTFGSKNNEKIDGSWYYLATTIDYTKIYNYSITETETQGSIDDISVEIHIPLWGNK